MKNKNYQTNDNQNDFDLNKDLQMSKSPRFNLKEEKSKFGKKFHGHRDHAQTLKRITTNDLHNSSD